MRISANSHNTWVQATHIIKWAVWKDVQVKCWIHCCLNDSLMPRRTKTGCFYVCILDGSMLVGESTDRVSDHAITDSNAVHTIMGLLAESRTRAKVKRIGVIHIVTYSKPYKYLHVLSVHCNLFVFRAFGPHISSMRHSSFEPLLTIS